MATLFKKLLSLLNRKHKAKFKDYIISRDSELCYVTNLPNFPHSADYRDLKYFVNINKLPYEIASKLEGLHDDYHLRV